MPAILFRTEHSFKTFNDMMSDLKLKWQRLFNKLRSEKNTHYFAENIYSNTIFLITKSCIVIQIYLKFVL